MGNYALNLKPVGFIHDKRVSSEKQGSLHIDEPSAVASNCF